MHVSLYWLAPPSPPSYRCLVCRQDLESTECLSTHLESPNHGLHKAFREAGMGLSFSKRIDLINNKISLVDGWLFCTLCTKKSSSYEMLASHMECTRHKTRVQAFADEGDDIDGNVTAGWVDAVWADSKDVQPPKSCNAVERMDFCLEDMRALSFSICNTPADRFKNTDIHVLEQKCEIICKVTKDITTRLKTIRDQNKVTAKIILMQGESMTCVVCFDRNRERLLLPCRHLAVCSECCASLNPRMCPICRSPVKSEIEIIAS